MAEIAVTGVHCTDFSIDDRYKDIQKTEDQDHQS